MWNSFDTEVFDVVANFLVETGLETTYFMPKI